MRLIDAENLKSKATSCIETTDGFKKLIDEQKTARPFILNPDYNVAIKVIEAIIRNEGHCPCQIEKSDDTLCPCVDFYHGECHCKLYINKE